MPYLSPQTLTRAEQQALLRATSVHPRDHLIFSLALGTGLRLAEIVGLDVGNVFFPDGTPRARIHLRITKNGRPGDAFLPDALGPKLRAFWQYKQRAGEGLEDDAPLFCNQSGGRISKRRVQVAFKVWQVRAGFDRLYPLHAPPAHGRDQRLPGLKRPLPRPAVRTTREPSHHRDLYPCVGRRLT